MRAQKRGTSEQERVSLIRQNQKFILYKKSTRTKTTTSTAKHKHFTAADRQIIENLYRKGSSYSRRPRAQSVRSSFGHGKDADKR